MAVRSVRAAQCRGPPRQGCPHVPLAVPRACSGGSNHDSSSPILHVGCTSRQWQHSWSCLPSVCLPPRKGNQLKLEAAICSESAGTGHPTLVIELVEDLGHFPLVNQASEGVLIFL